MEDLPLKSVDILWCQYVKEPEWHWLLRHKEPRLISDRILCMENCVLGVLHEPGQFPNDIEL
jgi:hypothetical protein